MFAAPQAVTTTSRREPLLAPVPLDDDLSDGSAVGTRPEPDDPRVREQRDVRVLECGPHTQHLGVRLRMHETREAVAGRAADAGRERRVGLVEHDPARRMKRPVSRGREVVGELLDPWLVRHGGMRVRRARGRLGRVLPTRPVHVVELLRERVVRLQLLVGDRPGRRDAVVVLQLAEVLLAEPVQRRAVHFRCTTDEVMDSGLERLTLGVVPGVGRDVAVVDEHRLRDPVLELAREPVAALEQEDALAGRSKVTSERPAARPGSDDDDVVGVHHVISSSRSARMIRPAASISARWEKACGKLPRWRPVFTSNSSA